MDFTLREFCQQDAQSIQLNANCEGVARFMSDGFPFPFSLEDAGKLVERLQFAPKESVLARAICVNGAAVGAIGLFRKEDVYRKSADLAYWLGERYWGHGIMPRAITAVCGEGFLTLDIVRIQAEPFYDNRASQRVLEKAGFVMEGRLRSRVFKNGRLQDACLYALLRNA